jgi:hypothetical protein
VHPKAQSAKAQVHVSVTVSNKTLVKIKETAAQAEPDILFNSPIKPVLSGKGLN